MYDWAELTRESGTWYSLEFRRQFGVARQVFDNLVHVSNCEERFKNYTWGEKRGCPTQPLIQKVAGAIFVLTKNQTMAAAGRMAGVGTTTLQSFFREWIKWLRFFQCPKHIYLPSGEHLHLVMSIYEKMGFPGAVASTDGVHVLWSRCPAKWKWINTGEKKCPSRVYNISVGPNTEVFHVPPASFPGALPMFSVGVSMDYGAYHRSLHCKC